MNNIRCNRTQKDSSVCRYFGMCPEWKDLARFLEIEGVKVDKNRNKLNLISTAQFTVTLHRVISALNAPTKIIYPWPKTKSLYLLLQLLVLAWELWPGNFIFKTLTQIIFATKICFVGDGIIKPLLSRNPSLLLSFSATPV